MKKMKKILYKIKKYFLYLKEKDELMKLSERELKDIGLSKYDILNMRFIWFEKNKIMLQ